MCGREVDYSCMCPTNTEVYPQHVHHIAVVPAGENLRLGSAAALYNACVFHVAET